MHVNPLCHSCVTLPQRCTAQAIDAVTAVTSAPQTHNWTISDACAAWLPLCACVCLQVQYLALHLSSLLLLPDARQALARLPASLLVQLLSSEALEVEQVGSGGRRGQGRWGRLGAAG